MSYLLCKTCLMGLLLRYRPHGLGLSPLPAPFTLISRLAARCGSAMLGCFWAFCPLTLGVSRVTFCKNFSFRSLFFLGRVNPSRIKSGWVAFMLRFGRLARLFALSLFLTWAGRIFAPRSAFGRSFA